VNFRRFQIGVDRCLHRDEVIVTAKLIHEPAKIGERHGLR
jgi:hypothetical protein